MKKTISMVFIVFLVFTVVVQPVKAEINGSVQSKNEFEVKDIIGVVKEQTNEGLQMNSEQKSILSNLKVSQEDGIVNLNGELMHNKETYNLLMSGVLYPIKGQGIYAENLVLGDIEGNDKFNVLQFRIERNSNNTHLLQKNNNLGGQTVLTIILECKKTGAWIYIQDEIQENIFDYLFRGANIYTDEKKMTDDEIKGKIISLSNINNKSDIVKQQEKSLQVEKQGVIDTEGALHDERPISIKSSDHIPVNFRELNKLLGDLNDPFTDSVNLSDYNLPEALFKGSGWKHDALADQSPRWNYYAYSAQQGDWYTITQITTFQHGTAFLDWRGNYTEFDIALKYKDGMIFEYDHHTKEISVMYYGFGLTLENTQLVQGALEGRNVYIAQRLSGINLTKGSAGDIIKYFVGLIPHSDKITNLWKALKFSKNEELGQRERFIGSTYEEQKEMHDGKVYRSISGNLNKWQIKDPGANTNIIGEIHSGDKDVRLSWGYRTTVATNLR